MGAGAGPEAGSVGHWKHLPSLLCYRVPEITETGRRECFVTLVYHFTFMLAWTSGIHGLLDIIELIIIIGATNDLAPATLDKAPLIQSRHLIKITQLDIAEIIIIFGAGDGLASSALNKSLLIKTQSLTVIAETGRDWFIALMDIRHSGPHNIAELLPLNKNFVVLYYYISMGYFVIVRSIHPPW